MIGKGSLIQVRETSPAHAGSFWYVVGVIGGKPKCPKVFMLARHPRSTWKVLIDANEVTEAVNIPIASAVGF
jgi:hypothetical protein